jgi:hypothetical protein
VFRTVLNVHEYIYIVEEINGNIHEEINAFGE